MGLGDTTLVKVRNGIEDFRSRGNTRDKIEKEVAIANAGVGASGMMARWQDK